MSFRFVAPALVGVAFLASVGHSTVRCRTADGRIYIGPEPPAGCEIEASYGSTPPADTPAPEPAAAATVNRPREPSPPRAPARSPRIAVPASPRAPGREAIERDEPSIRRSAGPPAALARKRARLERALDAVIVELERVERASVDRHDPQGGESSPEATRARLRRDAERRQELEPLRRRQGELRARRDRIRAEFAELTSRVAVANGGSLPGWWPAELRCGRCP